MCGRYDNLIAREAYRLLFRAKRLPQSNYPPRYNIAPTDPIPIVRVDPRDGTRELVMARWGLVPCHEKTIGASRLRRLVRNARIAENALLWLPGRAPPWRQSGPSGGSQQYWPPT